MGFLPAAKVLNLFNRILYDSSIWVASVLPKRLALLYALAVARGVMLIRWRQTQILSRQVALLRPGISPRHQSRLVRLIYRAYAESCVDGLFETRVALAQSVSRTLTRMRVLGVERLDRSLAKGRGVVMLSFHAGSWDLGALRLAYLGYPVTVMRLGAVNDTQDPISVRRKRWGCAEISNKEPLTRMKEVLNRNGILGLLIDRNYGFRSARVLSGCVELQVASGGYALAALTGAEIVAAVCRRRGGEYTLELASFGAISTKKMQSETSESFLNAVDFLRKKSGLRWYLFMPVIQKRVFGRRVA